MLNITYATYCCIQKARDNVAKVAKLSFDEVADASWRTWEETLSRISIEDDASLPAAVRDESPWQPGICSWTLTGCFASPPLEGGN